MNSVRYYIQGYSYQEIAEKTGISKGSVVSIITDLKSGKFYPLENITDEIDALREIAVDLRRRGVSLSQATMGLSAYQGFEALGVQPSEVGKVVAQVRQLTPEGTEPQDFISAVSVVMELNQRTRMAPKELEERVGELEGQYHTLERQCKELEPMC